jgi:hypothetical protein
MTNFAMISPNTCGSGGEIMVAKLQSRWSSISIDETTWGSSCHVPLPLLSSPGCKHYASLRTHEYTCHLMVTMSGSWPEMTNGTSFLAVMFAWHDLGDQPHLLTAEDRFQYQSSKYGICGTQFGSRAGFSPKILVFSCKLSRHQCSILIYHQVLVRYEHLRSQCVLCTVHKLDLHNLSIKFRDWVSKKLRTYYMSVKIIHLSKPRY